MLHFAQYIVATFLFVISAGAILRALRITRATRRQRQFLTDLAGSYCSLGVAGCSILCSQIKEFDHIISLLSTEYDRYEVIVVLDSNLYPESFNQILHHFKMILVNTPDVTELANTHIRSLYRSRLRCFRKLIVIDQGYVSLYDDLNAATTLASYDYVIPLATTYTLRSTAIDNIITTLSERDNSGIDLIESSVDGCVIFHRDAIVEAGGFSHRIKHKIARNKRLSINFPLLCINHTTPPTIYICATISVTLFIGICYIVFGYKIAIISILTAIIIVVAAQYTARSIDQESSRDTTLWYIFNPRWFFCR